MVGRLGSTHLFFVRIRNRFSTARFHSSLQPLLFWQLFINQDTSSLRCRYRLRYLNFYLRCSLYFCYPRLYWYAGILVYSTIPRFYFSRLLSPAATNSPLCDGNGNRAGLNGPIALLVDSDTNSIVVGFLFHSTWVRHIYIM